MATISVPAAGRLFYDLARNASYDAARRGDIPTVHVGRIVRVPVVVIAQQLGLRARLTPNEGEKA